MVNRAMLKKTAITMSHATLLTVGLSTNVLAKDASKSDGLDYLSLSLEELGKVKISIATGNNTPIEKAPAVATVITSKQIEAMGARTLDEVLETVPGLHVSPSGTNRLSSIYSIRGIHTSPNPHVLLLINDSAIQYPASSGRPPQFRQAINNISRIEIIRGPGSSIYGADAFSGVINIITKPVSEISTVEAGGRIGSFDYTETWTQTSQRIKNWDVVFNVNHQHSNGDSDRVVSQDSQTSLDAISGTNASLAPAALSSRYEIFDAALALENNAWNINMRAWTSKDAGNGVGGAQALDAKSGDDYTLYTSDATFKTNDWFDHWTNSVKLNYSYFELDADFILLPPGTTLGIDAEGNVANGPTEIVGFATFSDGLIGNPSTTTEDAQLEFINIYEGIENYRWRLSFGKRYQSIETNETKNFGPGVISGSLSPDPSNPTIIDGTLTDVSNTENVYLQNTSRIINYLSLQNEWAINNKWQLVTGVRHDNYSDFGRTTNPRIALVWEASKKLTSKLLYGKAFRAPSFGELGFKNNPSFIGNRSLKPEKIQTYELSFAYHAQLQSTLSLFTYKAEDLIEYIPNQNGNYTENIRDQKGYGFEWEATWKINKEWRINGNYAYQQSEDRRTGNDIADAPGQQLTLNTSWQAAPQWLIHTQANWVADRKRATNDNRSDISDYTLVDLTIRRANLYKNFDIALGVRNVFDAKAKEPSSDSIPNDFLLEGRSLWSEIRYQF